MPMICDPLIPGVDELLNTRDRQASRIADLEDLQRRLADALAHTCDRLERCDARLLRLTGQPCEGPLGEVARGRALVDEACLSQLRGQR